MDNFASERPVVGSDRNSLLLCGVPVLGDLPVLDAEHVEPGSRVRLRRVLRISKLPHEAEHDDIPFRRDGDKSGGHLGLDRLRLFELGEIHKFGHKKFVTALGLGSGLILLGRRISAVNEAAECWPGLVKPVRQRRRRLMRDCLELYECLHGGDDGKC